MAADPLEQPTEVLEPARGGEGITLAAHPRFSAAVRKVRGIAGLAGFAIAAWTSYHPHGFAGALLRGVVVGVVCQFLVGLVAVLAGRHLVAAELHAHHQRALEANQRRQGRG
jgi:hypothetical protein